LRAVTFDLGGTLVEYEHVPWEELEATGWRGLHDHLAASGVYRGAADDFTGAMMRASARFWQRAVETQQSARLHDVFVEAIADLRRLGQPGEPGELGLAAPALAALAALPNPDDFLALAEHFHAATVDLVSVYDDSLATLGELKRRGLKLALISNTLWPGALHTRDLRRFGLDAFFDVLTYSSETPHTKPHPSIFLETLRKLGDVPPEGAVHVGDRLVDDVQGAQRAGMKGVLKTHPRRVPAEGVEPDARIDRLADLPAVLDRLFSTGD
jgi:putative hydrolase of the HAD superfamily